MESGRISVSGGDAGGLARGGVIEVNEARFTDFADETTRRYLHEKLDAYTADLRKNQFPVAVYRDRWGQLEQQEAGMVKSLAEKAQQPGSVRQQRIEEMQKHTKPSR